MAPPLELEDIFATEHTKRVDAAPVSAARVRGRRSVVAMTIGRVDRVAVAAARCVGRVSVAAHVVQQAVQGLGQLTE